MIHDSTELNTAEPVTDWRENITIGDIVNWPLSSEITDKPGDSKNLALVIDIEMIGGWRVLTVAPGVEDHAQPARPGTLRLTRLDEVRDAGLLRPIRFELGRRISVAPQNPGVAAAADSPVIGISATVLWSGCTASAPALTRGGISPQHGATNAWRTADLIAALAGDRPRPRRLPPRQASRLRRTGHEGGQPISCDPGVESD